MALKEVELKVEEEEPLVARKECLEQVRKIVLDNNKYLVSEIASRVMSDVEERLGLEIRVSDIASRLRSDVEVQLEITEDWVGQVTKMLELDKNSLPQEVVLPRVATALMNVNPEAYIPRFISLGPYHHWKLKKDIASSASGTYQGRSLKISTAEEYKVKSAATISQTLRKHGKSFNSMVETIEEMRSEIEQFYDWKIEDGQGCKNFALMMAVDSSFLLRFLFSLFRHHPQHAFVTSGHQAEATVSRREQAQPATASTGPDQPQPVGAPSPGSLPSHDARINLSALQVCIKCDILKLENQIPLRVLQHVFDSGKDVLAEEHERKFSYLLKKTYTALSPFEVADLENLIITDAVATKPHLLDCMQAIVSPFLQMKVDEKDNRPDQPLFQKAKHCLANNFATVCGIFITHPINRGHSDFLSAYNAEHLHKAGIKFKSFSNPREQIRFDRYSGTLYLPRITVSHIHTEVFLRNMLALEFNDPARPNSVTRYVGLMDCLIDTPNDVRLLRHCDVIRRPSLMLTDESVAKMWDGMCQPFFTGHLEPPEELKEALHEELIKKYYKSIITRALREFHGEYLSRPWKVIALLIGCCVLAITVIQGYCSFTECSGKSDDSKNSKQKRAHGS